MEKSSTKDATAAVAAVTSLTDTSLVKLSSKESTGDAQSEAALKNLEEVKTVSFVESAPPPKALAKPASRGEDKPSSKG